MKKKIIISTIIIIFVTIFIYNEYITDKFFGWFHITGKEKINDTYYINCFEGNFELMDTDMIKHMKKEQEEFKIEVKDDYKFKFYFEETKEPKDKSISDIWHYIQPENSYFLRLTKNGFPKNLFRAYTIEELYLY